MGSATARTVDRGEDRMTDRITPVDIKGRKMIDAVHIDYARGSSAWMGQVDGIPRLSVARGTERGQSFMRWYVDTHPVRDLDVACAVINGDMTLEAAMQPDLKPTKKYSLQAQITEVKRELAQREKVYPNLVRSQRLKEGQAEYQVDTLKGVLATLEWLQSNEADVRAFVAEKVAARDQAEPTREADAA